MTTTRSTTNRTFTATPILLLKTKSTPHDNYGEYFSARGYEPVFVPVLEHRFNDSNLARVKELFVSGSLNPGPDRKYGGLIFTSQRAVEGFARVVVEEVGVPTATEASHSLPIYTVGPATSRSLTTIRDSHLPFAEIHGSDTGNGENLAKFIRGHYNELHNSNNKTVHVDENNNEIGGNSTSGYRKLPLLFLTGEKHRDIIPKTLMDEERLLPDHSDRIDVHEHAVYETGVMGCFEREFRDVVDRGRLYLAGNGDGSAVTTETGDGVNDQGRGRTGRAGRKVMWIVIFSPTGCDTVLRVLGLGSGSSSSTTQTERETETGLESTFTPTILTSQTSADADTDTNRQIFLATIGPTTRDHLRKNYGIEPDVCAEKPSQDGVGKGIEEFMELRGLV